MAQGSSVPLKEADSGEGWIEIFHYAPLWHETRIVYSLNGGEWLDPSQAEALELAAARLPQGDSLANHRVFVCRAHEIKFVLCDGNREAWDNNHGSHYCISHSGAYVVGDGRNERIRDADVAACDKASADAAMQDLFIELEYESSPLWLTCRMIYRKDAERDWTPVPGVALRRYGVEANHWFIRVQARKLEFAFLDQLDNWDSNQNSNYRVGRAGKYRVTPGSIQYLGVSDFDSQLKQ
ncbi:hypothetical protein FVE85_7720 [Porphyridium purpureum]|uniref:Uncharacterized protein n=1 Tax=Porphyridium purpureum TaxID=35688 RepID=A0A5J4YIT6_PORPP|nr:hypothetical protein FVE85_7720 [Porphyridium purpureum]|eukprot:POR1430..scf210_14